MESIQIKGSKGYYSVDLEKLTCTCKDFTCRRHHYSIEDPKRLCKHIREAMDIVASGTPVTNSVPSMFTKDEIKSKYIDDIQTLLENDSNVIRFDVVGDYRRNLYKIGKLEIVVRVLYKDLSTSLESKYSLEYKSQDKEVYLTDSGLNIEVVKVDNNSYPFKVFNFTGGYNFLVTMKSVARRKGLELTECGFVGKDDILINSEIGNEDDIFNYLGIDYVDPKDRIY